MSTKPISARFGLLDDTATAEELILGALQSIGNYADMETDADFGHPLTQERRKFYGGVLKVAVDYYLTRLEPARNERLFMPHAENN